LRGGAAGAITSTMIRLNSNLNKLRKRVMQFVHAQQARSLFSDF
jgi:hypothetical protein